jgi:hypothetical protein
MEKKTLSYRPAPGPGAAITPCSPSFVSIYEIISIGTPLFHHDIPPPPQARPPVAYSTSDFPLEVPDVPVDSGRPTVITATSHTASVRGKPSRPT